MSTLDTETRTEANDSRPPAGVWSIDPGHAEVAFIGRHFGLTKIRGRFVGVDGTVRIADRLEDSTVDVTIDMATVDSGDTTRDDHLRSADFFHVERHPTATFRADELTVDGPTGTLVGELTIVGVTRPVDVTVDYLGAATDPWDNERLVFSATTTINREDWGLTWNMLLGTGGLLVSKEIRIEIDLELIRQAS